MRDVPVKEFQEGVDFREASWVRVSGHWYRISSKWGINQDGSLAKPSEGGFGCTTDIGERVPMMKAELYGKQK